LGLGLPAEPEPSPAIFEQLWRSWMMLLAHGFGVAIDDYRHQHESSVASRTYDLPAGRIEKGTVSAIHHTVEGLVDGVPRIRAEGTYWFGDQGYPDDWEPAFGSAGYKIKVNGRPDMTALFDFAGGEHAVMQGPMAAACEATSARAVNMIPAVCEAEPGLLTFFDLPLVMPKVAWTSATVNA
jgi:2,4-diaminopentanoate dehydrogenase